MASPREEDKMTIVANWEKKQMALKFFKDQKKLVKEPLLVFMGKRNADGEEPPKRIANMMRKSSLILAPTTYSLSHTEASREAIKNGAKIVSMPAISEEILDKYCSLDREKIRDLSHKLKKLLDSGKEVRVKTENGTDLKINIGGREGMAMDGICNEGSFINLPDGEALISPKGGEGKLVIDGSMPPDTDSKWGKIGLIDSPIILEIEDGKIKNIEGEDEAKVLENLFNDYSPKARFIAEFAFGTNPEAKIIGNVTVDEKALGTIHIAFGNSSSIGGNNNVPLHLDAIVRKPKVWIDGELILEKGEFKI